MGPLAVRYRKDRRLHGGCEPGTGDRYVIVLHGADLSIERTIVAFHDGGDAFLCADSQVTFRCCNVFGNRGSEICDDDLGGNFSADPLFCGASNGDYTLDASSHVSRAIILRELTAASSELAAAAAVRLRPRAPAALPTDPVLCSMNPSVRLNRESTWATGRRAARTRASQRWYDPLRGDRSRRRSGSCRYCEFHTRTV